MGVGWGAARLVILVLEWQHLDNGECAWIFPSSRPACWCAWVQASQLAELTQQVQGLENTMAEAHTLEARLPLLQVGRKGGKPANLCCGL